MDAVDAEFRQTQIRRFAMIVGLVAAFLALVPALIALLTTPPGGSYLGSQFNTDDQMVYAAWTRQAMEGRLLMDNRFTTDPQPSLTVNLYFFVLGTLARLIGYLPALLLARALLAFAFVQLLSKFVLRLDLRVHASKMALALGVFGGGLGFLAWQAFGRALTGGQHLPITGLLRGLAPIDVWQPEAFVFPSMLTNALFMAAFCLMLVVLLCVLDCMRSWRVVGLGALASFLLMNSHSYDMLLLTLVLACAAIAGLLGGSLSWPQVFRGALILCGALPAAAWFAYVLANDPVFQSRAATPTYSADFRVLLFGVAPAVALALVAFWKCMEPGTRRLVSVGCLGALLLAFFFAAPTGGDRFAMGWPAWASLFVLACVLSVAMSSKSFAWTLLVSWALVALLAPYTPLLFQRKLAMGLAIPWCLLAAIGFARLAEPIERSARNLAAALTVLILSGSSIRWLQRELLLIRNNVSSTTVQPVFLANDVTRILSYLQRNAPAGSIALSMPGVPRPTNDPDRFETPAMPDLNPVLTGLTGVYTYAGHWSETPLYARRRNELMRLYLAGASEEERRALLKSTGATYVIAPIPGAFPELPLANLSGLGRAIIRGERFELIKAARD